MADPIEERLAALARSVPIPPPPTAAVLARARRRRARRFAPVALAVVAVVIAAVVPTVRAGDHGGRPSGATAAPAVFTGTLEDVRVGSVSPADLGGDTQAFGLRLLQDVCSAHADQNTVLSPYSAAEALGMLQTGAEGGTRTSLSTLLHEPAYGPDLVAAEQQRTADLRKVSDLSVSNRLFTETGVRPAQATLDDLRTAYDAQLRTLDFASAPKASTDAINRLVSGDTRGLIPTLFDQPLDPSTVAVLTDAIYLRAQWQVPFDDPTPGRFTTAAGDAAQVPTLHSPEAVGASATAAGWQSVSLPYVGGRLTAYALLPPAGGATCAVPSAAAFATLLDPTGPAAMVSMPQFHLTQSHDLLDVLGKEGLDAGGDYSGFSADASVSQVVQQVDISVDRNGTVAAAATGVAMASSAEISRTVVDLDRPFLFVVVDTATHTPLFLTRVADPRT